MVDEVGRFAEEMFSARVAGLAGSFDNLGRFLGDLGADHFNAAGQ
jgi:hypothetical protein